MLGRSPWTARAVLAMLAVLWALGLGHVHGGGFVDRAGRGQDTRLYAAIVADLRSGTGYYAAASAHLRSDGYASTSPFNYRLPTLALLMAAFPSDAYARGLLVALSAAVLVAWLLALRPHTGTVPTLLVLLALSGLLAWPCIGQAFLVHETWAGLAIALSLALFALGQGVAAMLIALAAMALRELALPYVLLCLVFAFRAQRRAELAIGATGLACFVAAYLAHTALIRQATSSVLSAKLPWLALGGYAFVLKTARMSVWLLNLPVWVAAIVFPLALAGLLVYPQPLGARLRATVILYLVLFLVIGLPYNHLWGLLYAAPALTGIVFAPAALTKLVRTACARRVNRQ